MISRLLALTLLALPAAAVAQDSPAQLRERVSQVSDTAALHTMEEQYASAETSDGQIAAGIAALRLWEVTGDRKHARRSRKHFDRAADENPKSAWAHFGHALSLEAEIRREPGFIVTHLAASRDLGFDPVSRARRALERAVALDPNLPGALDLLARYAAETHDEESLLQARTAFEQAAANSRAGASTLIGLAITARELGDYEESAAAAQRAVEANPESAAAWLELTISLASMPDSLPAAGRAYGNAVRYADDAMIEELWKDAELLQNTREAAAWRFAEPQEKRPMLHTFWAMRGALSGLTAEERAAEHYRRLAVAESNFGRRSRFGASDANALKLEKVSTQFDDRGVIYIKHGAPIETVGEPPLQGYLAWIYRDEQNEPISYHFFGSGRDYILMRNLPCPIDPEVASLDRRLSPLLWRCDVLNVRSVSVELNRDALRALETDSHRQNFLADLPFHYDWYSFRSDAGTEILMTVGVPLDQLPEGERSLRVSLSIVDTLFSSIAQTSVVTEPVAHSNEPGRIMRTHLSLIAQPAGRDAYRVDVRDATNGRIGTVYGGDIRIPDYRGERVMISDIVLAEPVDGNLVRGDQRLALAPTQVFQDGRFRVYYELYNMPAGKGYFTQLEVEPVDDGGIGGSLRRLFGRGDGVQLRFEDFTPEDHTGTLQQMRDVTAPFRPGAYLLRLTIRTDAGTVTKERRFTIENN